MLITSKKNLTYFSKNVIRKRKESCRDPFDPGEVSNQGPTPLADCRPVNLNGYDPSRVKTGTPHEENAMSYSNIDATLSDADLQAIKDHYAGIISKLPFLVNLTNVERQRLLKTGSDSLSFVQNALAIAQGNTTILPASFDKEGFARDVELFAILSDLQTMTESLTQQLDDTRMAVGSEAMVAATQTYSYVRTAEKTTPGLRPAMELLGERFQKASRSKEPDETAEGAGGTQPGPSTQNTDSEALK